MLSGTGRDFEAVNVWRRSTLTRTPENGRSNPGAPGSRVCKSATHKEGSASKCVHGIRGWDTQVTKAAARGNSRSAARIRRWHTELVTDLGQRMDDVVILTIRSLAAPHAERQSRKGRPATPVLIGKQCRGGRFKGLPGLKTAVIRRPRLALTTDFRDVFGEMTSNIGHTEHRQSLPGTQRRVRGISN